MTVARSGIKVSVSATGGHKMCTPDWTMPNICLILLALDNSLEP